MRRSRPRAHEAPPTAVADDPAPTARTTIIERRTSSSASIDAADAPPTADDAGPEAVLLEMSRRNPTDVDRSGAYAISRATKSGRVAVNLVPGHEVFMPADDGSMTPLSGPRSVRGRVLHPDGTPISGAVVVAGNAFREMMSTIDAQAAATSDAHGVYLLLGVADQPFQLMAMHPVEGWSAPVHVDAGTSDLTQDLVVQANGALVGQLTRNGDPVRGSVRVRTLDGAVARATRCAANGTYRVDWLAAGQYIVSASSVPELGAARGRVVESLVEIRLGETTTHDIALPIGVTVAISVSTTRDHHVVDYFFAPGTRTPTVRDDLHDFQELLLGGGDMHRPAEYRDLDPGTYTWCAAARKDREDDPMPTCRTITVAADPADQTFVIDIP